MKRFDAGLAVAAIAAFGCLAAPAIAAPPTVTPSPGYDARLQESRAVRTVHEPVMRAPKPISRHRAKRVLGTR